MDDSNDLYGGFFGDQGGQATQQAGGDTATPPESPDPFGGFFDASRADPATVYRDTGKRWATTAERRALLATGDSWQRPAINADRINAAISQDVPLQREQQDWEQAHSGVPYDEDAIRKHAVEQFQGKLLQDRLQRFREAPASERAVEYVVPKLPGVGAPAAAGMAMKVSQSVQRIKEDRATLEDYDNLARAMAEDEQNASRGNARKFVDILAEAPAFLTEWAMTGGAGAAGREAATIGAKKLIGEIAERRLLKSAIGAAGEGLARTAVTELPTAAAALAGGENLGDVANRVGTKAVSNIAFSAAGGPPGAHADVPVYEGLSRALLAGEAAKEADYRLGLGGQGSVLTRLMNDRPGALADFLVEAGAFATLDAAAKVAPVVRQRFDQLRRQGIRTDSDFMVREVDKTINQARQAGQTAPDSGQAGNTPGSRVGPPPDEAAKASPEAVGTPPERPGEERPAPQGVNASEPGRQAIGTGEQQAEGTPQQPVTGAARPFEQRFPVGASVEYTDPGSVSRKATGEVVGYRKDPTTGDTFAAVRLPGGRTEYVGDANDIRQPTTTRQTTPGQPPAEGSPLWSYADRLEKEARAELRDLFGDGKLFSGVDPTAIASLGKLAAAKVLKGSYTLAKFTADMVQRFGESVRPHVEAAWNHALAELQSRREALRKLVGSGPPAEQLARVFDAAGVTEHERAILRQRALGRGLGDIAGDTGVSRQAVEIGETKARGKLGMAGSMEEAAIQPGREEALLDAVERGLIATSDRVPMPEISGDFDPATGRKFAKLAYKRAGGLDEQFDSLTDSFLKEAENAQRHGYSRDAINARYAEQFDAIRSTARSREAARAGDEAPGRSPPEAEGEGSARQPASRMEGRAGERQRAADPLQSLRGELKRVQDNFSSEFREAARKGLKLTPEREAYYRAEADRLHKALDFAKQGPGSAPEPGTVPDSPVLKLAARLESEAAEAIRSAGHTAFSEFAAGGKAAEALAKFIAAKILRGGYAAHQWAKDAVARFGKEIEPHITAIFARAEEVARGAMTGINNATVNRERAGRGEAPLETAARASDPQAWDQARQAVAADPSRAQRLVDELAAKPRAIDRNDTALLLHAKVEATNSYSKALTDLIAARRGGDMEAVAQAENAEAHWRERRDKVDQAAKSTGTIWSDAGRLRQRLAAEDYSLGSMVRQKEAAKQRPLTQQEQEQTAHQAATIQELQAKLDAQEAINRRQRIEASLGSYGEQLKDLTAELIDQDRAMHEDVQQILREARAKLRDTVVPRPDNPTLRQLAKVDSQGRMHLDLSNPTVLRTFGDHASIPGFDELADELARKYGGTLRDFADADATEEGRSAADKLLEWLQHPPKPLTRSEAKARAEAKLADAGFDFDLGFGEKPQRVPRSARSRQELDDAWANFKKVAGGAFSNPFANPEAFVAMVKVAKAAIKHGAAKVADFIDQVRERGVAVTPDHERFLARAYDQAQQDIAAERRARAAARLKGVDPADAEAIGTVARKLYRDHALGGIQGTDERVAAVHEDLARAIPGLTRAQAEDALAARGPYRPRSQSEVEAELRELRRQRSQPTEEAKAATRQTSALEAAKDRTRRQITSLSEQVATGERRMREQGRVEPDAELKKLISVRDALKADYDRTFGRPGDAAGPEAPGGTNVPPDAAAAPPSRVRRAAEAAQRQIEDLGRRIEQKDFDRRRGRAVSTPELEALRARRDALREEYQSLRDADPDVQKAKDAKQLQAAVERTQESIADLQRRIQEGETAKQQRGERPTSPELEHLRSQRDDLQKQMDRLRRDAAEPKRSPEDIADQRLKTYYAHKEAALRERLARGDFAPERKPERTPGPEVLKAKADYERAKQDFQNGLEKDRQAKLSGWEKTREFLLKLRRAELLSRPSTALLKIPAAATEKMVFNTLEELTGAAWGSIPGIRAISQKASVQGGLSLKAEAAAWTRGILNGGKDAYQKSPLGSGKADIDVLYGGKEEHGPRQRLLDFFGELHSAAKAVPFRAAFERNLQKLYEFNKTRGVNVDDATVQVRLATEAYKQAEDARFMEDNVAVDAWRSGLRKMATKDSSAAKLGAFLGEYLLPILKVPANFSAQVTESVAGVPIGLTRAIYGRLVTGVEHMPEATANGIIRQLKRGSVGGALVAVGYFMPQIAGGYYQPGDKRDEDDVKAGTVRLFGVNVPSILLHSPPIEALQVGATIRRYADSRWSNKMGGEKKGFLQGVGAAAVGVLEEVPFVREMTHIDKLLNPKEWHKAIPAEVKSAAVPGVLDELAQQLDKRTPFSPREEPRKREPEGVLQTIETGIPGLRQKVPEKKK